MVYDPRSHPAGLEREYLIAAVQTLGVTCSDDGDAVIFATGDQVEVIPLRKLVTRHTVGHIARKFNLESAQIWDAAKREKERARFRSA